MSPFIKELLIYIPTGMVLLIAFAWLVLKFFNEFEKFFATIFRWLGFLSKWFRKVNTELAYESSVNSMITYFNNNFSSQLLPKCKIQWVTDENQHNILNEDEAIICLSFDKQDQNKNFFNATLNFVKTAVIANAKKYIQPATRGAIDLITTHKFISSHYRGALGLFNEHFNENDETTRLEYERLIPTDERGLFFNLLLPELHHYGDLILKHPPTDTFKAEVEGFINWFHELATREFDDRTNLKYTSNNFKIGVILVAKLETWDKYGPSAYTKWGLKYAMDDYNAVYVLAVGRNRREKASIVSDILKQKMGFEQTNNNTLIKCYDENGNEYQITCYALKPNRTSLAYHAWENLKTHSDNDEPVSAIIDFIDREKVIVSVYGLRLEIPKAELSEKEVGDPTKLFKVDNELQLNILEIDADIQQIKLSNKGTETDPKSLIDATINNADPTLLIVKFIKKDENGIPFGLAARDVNENINVFIHRRGLSFSRFFDIEEHFKPGDEIEALIDEYDSTRGTFNATVANLEDPWATDQTSSFVVGSRIDAVVKQIDERKIVAEYQPGVECIIPSKEISWNEAECETSAVELGDNLTVTVLTVNSIRRTISCSIKRTEISQELAYFSANRLQAANARIERIEDRLGLFVELVENSIKGFIHVSEVTWGNAYPLSQNYSEGETIDAKVSSYNDDRNNILLSVKRLYQHDYERFKEEYQVGNTIQGVVIYTRTTFSLIKVEEINYDVYGYIRLNNVSNICFLESDDLKKYLIPGQKYHFRITGLNDKFESIELNRRQYLNDIREVTLGDTYDATYTTSKGRNGFFYSDNLEGKFIIDGQQLETGGQIEVLPISTESDEFEVL
jgi:small subunit ribosomal protein S1